MSFVLVILLFFSTAFFLEQSQSSHYSFISYVLTEGSFFLSHLYLSLVGLGLMCIISFRSLSLKKPLIKKLLHAFVHASVTTGIGFFIAYALLLFIAFLELNLFSLAIHINPSLMGIVADRSKISASLQSQSQSPDIIATDMDHNGALYAIAKATTGKNSFYANTILSAVPSFFVLPVSNLPPGNFLIDDTLVVTKIDPQDIEELSPLLGYQLVKRYFPNRQIKSYPHVSLWERNLYQAYRSENARKQIQAFSEDIQKSQESISSASATVASDKEHITQSETLLQDAKEKRLSEYKLCLFPKDKTKPRRTDCKDVKTHWENVITSTNQKLTDLRDELSNDENLLSQFAASEQIYTIQKNAAATLTNNIPFELGVFEPNNAIRIALNTTSSHGIADYLATLVHEYLHYTSFVSSSKRFELLFFEEGLTEYFARQVIQDDLHASTNLGYPLFEKIIREMTNVIPESDFADIYFTKDQDRLVETLDRTYGDGFYQKNRLIFAAMQITSDPHEAIELANTIMKQIGGKNLTEKDLQSSYSSFE